MDSRSLPTLIAQLGVLAAVVVANLVAYPASFRKSDESNYVATALKFTRELAITAATHREEDVLRHGLDHKPVKMPAYMVALAAWLTVVPDPDFVRVLNLLLFAGSVLLLYRYAVFRSGTAGLPSLLGAGAMFCVPMGLAYANTAMAEAFVLFAATLHFLSWYGRCGDRHRLLCFYLTGFLAFVTKETLALLTISILTVHAKQFWRLHVDLARTRRPAFVGHAVLALVLAAVALYCFTERGYYPNFRNNLAAADGLGSMLGMVGERTAENLAYFVSWDRFPNDYLYGYGLLVLGMAVALAWRSRGTPQFRPHSMQVVFWITTLLFVNTLYQNRYFNAHRIYGVCTLLTLAMWYPWVTTRVARPALRWTLLASPFALNLLLCVLVNRHFIDDRSKQPLKPHFLTVAGIVRDGDCLFASQGGHHFLAENQSCELISPFSETPQGALAVIDRIEPRFVAVDGRLDLSSRGYRKIGQYGGDRTRSTVMDVWMKDPDLARQVEAAVRSGIAFVAGAQNDDGSWGGDESAAEPRRAAHRRDRGALTALALYALAAAGASARDEAIVRGLKWAKDHPDAFGDDSPHGVYASSMLVLALSRINRNKHRRWILELADGLRDAQLIDGTWSSALARNKRSARARGRGVHRGDTFHTSVAVLALWSAQEMARYQVPDKTWKLARTVLEAAQQAGGGWSLDLPETATRGRRRRDRQPLDTEVTSAMTAAGLVSYVLATASRRGGSETLERVREEPVAKRGLAAFLALAPGHEDVDELYAIEHVGAVLDIPDPKWFPQGVEALASRQDPEGFFTAGEADRVYGTALALLFLTKATVPQIRPPRGS